ncbi:helix-turn-helix transcriptional regulator [Lactobacillus sp. PV037]|uniref:helix-turn-helix domain-containing protein n=1 Tax=Lactobacillus sp. PV037 TaxID=2594496 RepID=UPI00223F003D|nr:helix-turn-helix transcriptional regulator [Lactobacillus sp. PV037]QNQ83791.1 helix-turn-helix transcriptional regulator [Lactobacillus sp. PV037]
MSAIQNLRLEKNKTQKEVANAVGISNSLLSAYEHGKSKPKPTTLQKLANYFNVAVEDLKDPVDLSAVTARYNSNNSRNVSNYKFKIIQKYYSNFDILNADISIETDFENRVNQFIHDKQIESISFERNADKAGVMFVCGILYKEEN